VPSYRQSLELLDVAPVEHHVWGWLLGRYELVAHWLLQLLILYSIPDAVPGSNCVYDLPVRLLWVYLLGYLGPTALLTLQISSSPVVVVVVVAA
jgi:hypothetical protein